MNRTYIIQRAKQILINDRELNSILNRTGQVRVHVLLDTPASPSTGEPVNTNANVVTFTIEDHEHWGRRLMADYEGQKEFAA